MHTQAHACTHTLTHSHPSAPLCTGLPTGGGRRGSPPGSQILLGGRLPGGHAHARR